MSTQEEHPEGEEPAGEVGSTLERSGAETVPGEPDAGDGVDEAAPPEDGADGTAVEAQSGLTREPEGEPDEIVVDPARVRRAPRLGRFALVGVIIGVIAAAVQTLAARPEVIAEAGGPWASNTWGFFGLMAAIFVPLGALVLCAVGLVLDRRSRRSKGV